MKYPKHFELAIVLGVIVTLVSVGLAMAQGEAIGKWVIANGGGESRGGNITIKDTIGQPIVGPSNGASTALYAGYWYAEYHPTAVTLASFTAMPQGNTLVLRWTTFSEINTMGFNLYRATARTGAQTKLNASLIPSQTMGGLFGATYTYTDKSSVVGVTYYYWLEEVTVSGMTLRHGPITSGMPWLFLPFVQR